MRRANRFLQIGVFAFVGVLFPLTVFLLSGCTTTEPMVIARNVDVTGPFHQVPVRITDRDIDGHLRITPSILVTKKRNLDGATELNSDYDLGMYGPNDSTNNLHWNLPSYVAGLSIDYGLSRTLSFSAGGTYSKTNGKESFEWDVGLAACFQDKTIGGRLEAGLQWQDINYSALFDRYNLEHDWSTGEDAATYLYSFSRFGKFMTGNVYCNLTLNTKYQGSPVNGFVRVGYGVTSVLSNDMLRINENGDIATSVGFINITPGLYFNITRWNRLLLGCDFSAPVTMTSSTPDWLVIPVAQIDFTI